LVETKHAHSKIMVMEPTGNQTKANNRDKGQQVKMATDKLSMDIGSGYLYP
jgi:hypothetical protein